MNDMNYSEEPGMDGSEEMMGNDFDAPEDGMEGDFDAPEDGMEDDYDMPEDEPVGTDSMGDDEEDLDSLLEDFLNEEDLVAGDNKVMTHQNNPIKGTNNGIDGETSEDWKRIEEEDGYGDVDKSEDTETMDNYKFGFNKEKKLPAQSWDRMNESEKKLVRSLTESIYRKLVSENRGTSGVERYIKRLVNEEITRLDAWGKHPKYRKQPMTTPPNKEKFVGTADRDWNDDSAKGEQPYGLKIGNGKPFNQKVVDLLTDQVLAKIKGGNN
jgi:hypothetical protein